MVIALGCLLLGLVIGWRAGARSKERIAAAIALRVPEQLGDGRASADRDDFVDARPLRGRFVFITSRGEPIIVRETSGPRMSVYDWRGVTVAAARVELLQRLHAEGQITEDVMLREVRTVSAARSA